MNTTNYINHEQSTLCDFKYRKMTVYFQSIVISLIIIEKKKKILCRIIYKQIQLSQNF